MVGITRGGIFLIRPNVILKNLVLVRPRRSQNTQPASVLLVVLTWQEMCGNGVQAGMINPIIGVWSVAVPGPTHRCSCVLHTGTGAPLSSGTSASAFVLPRTLPNHWSCILLPFSLSVFSVCSSTAPINRWVREIPPPATLPRWWRIWNPVGSWSVGEERPDIYGKLQKRNPIPGTASFCLILSDKSSL